MFRFSILIFSLLLSSILSSQDSPNLVVHIGDFGPVSLHSVSSINTTEIIIKSDTTLFISCEKNNLFSIKNDINEYFLFLTEDGKVDIFFESKNKIFPKGSNAAFITFLNEYYSSYQPNFHINSSLFDYQNPDEFEINLYNFINNELYNFYKNYNSFNEFNNQCKKYFEKLIEYEYLNALSFFLFKKNILLNNDLTKTLPFSKNINIELLDSIRFKNSFIDTVYYDLEIFQDYIFNSLLLLSINKYDYNLNTIDDFQDFSVFFFNFLYDHVIDPQSVFYALKNYIMEFSSFLHSNTMDYLEVFLMNHNLDQKNVNQLKSIFLLNANEQIQGDLGRDVVMIHDFYMENLDGEQEFLDAFIGKVLYIDIWASWCGPCRKQFPYSKKLKNKFSKRQLKKINFLYISIDNSYEKWKKSLANFDIEGYHFISPSNNSNGAGAYFQASSIPRYILINKKGEIIEYNAKRPSDETLFDDLIKLIK